MIRRSQTQTAKPQAGRLLNILDHLFRFISMFTDYHMNVIRHDRTSVAGILMFAHRLCKAFADGPNLRRRKIRQRELKRPFGPLVEIANHRRRRLNSSPPVMKFTKLGDNFTSHSPTTASTRIVGQPRPISCQNQMMRNHNWSSHNLSPAASLSAACGLASYCGGSGTYCPRMPNCVVGPRVE